MVDSFTHYFKRRRIPVTIFFAVLLAHIGASFKNIDFSIKKITPVKKQRVIKVKLKTSKEKKRQIVRTEKSLRKTKPIDSKFLSENDQKVAREVVSKNVDTFKKAGLGVKNGEKKNSRKQVANEKKKLLKKKVSLKDLMIKPDQIQPIKRKPSVASAKKGQKHGDKSKTGLSSSNDFIEDVNLGDMTQLNTVRFKYYGFYERIRSKLEQFWGASIQEKARKLFASGSRFPASKNYITSLQITLDSNGKIIGINIKGSSGVRDLDEAAIESFNQAGPFPNPPRGLLKQGRATIEWGFVVKS